MYELIEDWAIDCLGPIPDASKMNEAQDAKRFKAVPLHAQRGRGRVWLGERKQHSDIPSDDESETHYLLLLRGGGGGRGGSGDYGPVTGGGGVDDDSDDTVRG